MLTGDHNWVVHICTCSFAVIFSVYPELIRMLFFFIFDMYTECDMFSRDKIMLWQSSPDALIININFFFIVGLG